MDGGAEIHPTAVVDAEAVIGSGTIVGPYCVIGPKVRLGARCLLRNHVTIEGPSEIGDENHFFPGSVVGSRPQDLKYRGEETLLVVGSRNIFRECVTINRGTVGGGGKTSIGNGCLFMAYSHVAHDCHLGNEVILANAATLAGHVTIGDCAAVGGLTPVHQFVRIGPYAFIGGQTRISQDVVPFARIAGIPPLFLGANSIGLKRRGFSEEVVEEISKALRILFRGKLTIHAAVKRIASECRNIQEIRLILEFLRKSERGILR
ncbi:MAG: acyl-ACP--UDP-N-acetylglucosamine O-acyltransferase [Candidatus Hydrogenedentota bacterium]|nr:MAG: acyl-ACP--UDP-N-acetylglucosamine O-acyltransferase [Candidatus Hydrogenedentota bacterium]